MFSLANKIAIRKEAEEHQPMLVNTAVFSQGASHATCFSSLYKSIGLHFGEVELAVRRAYEAGYADAKANREPRKYEDL